MRLLVQWARAAPQDWETIDSKSFRGLPKRDRPGKKRAALGDAAGYLYQCQAREDIWQGYDSLSVEHLAYVAGSDPLYDAMGVTDGQELTRLRGRNDDVRDWPVGSRWERVADYFPMCPQPHLGGAISPCTRHTIYAEPDTYAILAPIYARDRRTVVVEVQDLDTDWPAAAESDTRYGTWVGTPGQVDNSVAGAHSQALSTRSWREWADHLPSEESDKLGRLKSQRGAFNRYIPLKHTRTYYHSDTVLTSATHTGGDTPDFEQSLLLTTGVANTVTSGVSPGGQVFAVATSPAGEPDDAQWTSGAGTFVVRHQLDVPSAGVDLVYGLRTLSGSPGHFSRVQAGTPPSVELEANEQDEAAFSGGGLHLATYTGDWAAGATTDRFEIAIAADRVAGHGSQNLTLELNELDDFADGDWPGAAQIVVGAVATGSWTAPAAVVSAALTAVGVAATGSWVAPAAAVVAGAVSVVGQLPTASWVAPAAVVPGAIVVVAQLPTARWVGPPAGAAMPQVVLAAGPAIALWSGPAAAVAPGVVSAIGAVALATWEAPGAPVVAGAAPAPGVAASASWVALSATVAVGPVSVPAVAATGIWFAPSALVVTGPISAPGVAGLALWVAPAAAVIPGAVRTVVAPVDATWSAPAAVVAPGSVNSASVPALASWVAPAAVVAPGSVSAVGAAALASWTAPAATVVPGAVLVAAAPATGLWTTPAAVVAPGAAPAPAAPAVASWSAPAGLVVLGAAPVPGVAAVASWVAPAATVQPGEVVVAASPATGSWSAPAAVAVNPNPGAVGVAALATWVAPAAVVVVGGVIVGTVASTAQWVAPKAKVEKFPALTPRAPAVDVRLVVTREFTVRLQVSREVRGRMQATRTLLADLES